MNPLMFAAAGAFGLATWLALSAGSRGAVRRLRGVPEAQARASIPTTWPLAGAAATALVIVSAVAVGRTGAVLAGCVSMVGLSVMALVRSSLRDRQRQRRRVAVTEASETLAGLLRLGHIPARALATAAVECAPLREAAAAQSVGDDVADTLAKTARRPGYDDLTQVAAGWRIASATGASMQSTIHAVSTRLRADQQVSGVVRAELSAPRATGRLLAALPVAGLVLGYVIGGDPVGFLTANWVGELCLLAGVALMCAGLLWTDRLADNAGQLP